MTDETREARHLARCATCREDGAALGAALRAVSVAPLSADSRPWRTPCWLIARSVSWSSPAKPRATSAATLVDD